MPAARTTPPGEGPEQSAGLVEAWCRFAVQSITADVMRAATSTSARFATASWDAAVLEAARALGCRTVVSEDLDVGTDYQGARVEGPFREAAARR